MHYLHDFVAEEFEQALLALVALALEAFACALLISGMMAHSFVAFYTTKGSMAGQKIFYALRIKYFCSG